jgi:hypothetical protein
MHKPQLVNPGLAIGSIPGVEGTQSSIVLSVKFDRH